MNGGIIFSACPTPIALKNILQVLMMVPPPKD
jgi:hypothetical protein